MAERRTHPCPLPVDRALVGGFVAKVKMGDERGIGRLDDVFGELLCIVLIDRLHMAIIAAANALRLRHPLRKLAAKFGLKLGRDMDRPI